MPGLVLSQSNFDSNVHLAYGFNKQQRLLNSHAFTPVFTAPTFKIHTPNLLLFVQVNQGNNPILPRFSRLGLAITKKKIRRANQRNRLKRLVREHFRHHHYDLSHKVDIAVIVKHFPVTLSNAEIVSQLSVAFKQINAKLKLLSNA